MLIRNNHSAWALTAEQAAYSAQMHWGVDEIFGRRPLPAELRHIPPPPEPDFFPDGDWEQLLHSINTHRLEAKKARICK